MSLHGVNAVHVKSHIIAAALHSDGRASMVSSLSTQNPFTQLRLPLHDCESVHEN